MSVLVKNMEMPKNCDKCNIRDIHLCKLWMRMTISQRIEGKHPDCPLVEIPPHGRLIDADALKREFPHDSDWDYPVSSNCYVNDIIDKQPTIVEAEGEE